MERDLWSRAEPILDAALDLPPDERSALLDEQCGDDQALRGELEALLAECSEADGFLDPESPSLVLARAMPFDTDTGPGSAAPEERIGDRLGAYRLVDILGRGGMGTVYLGERADGLFEQQVAIKLARKGDIGTLGLERFHYERRILAGLEHANIARLFDGGISEEGLPFLVMERLEGEPLDRFCESEALDPEQRIALVIEVCRAVDHAHRRRVAHLDLKPSNILVVPSDSEYEVGGSRGGTVKLLDFGISELLASESGSETPNSTAGHVEDPTRPDIPRTVPSSESREGTAGRSTPSSFGLTPNFASPEQLAGRSVTSASDIYSIGVVLFLLLEGRLPYERGEGESVAAFAERVRSEPLPHLEDPELRAIVHRAMAENPADRFASASALADDLGRYLEDLPISVLPSSPTYVLTKHFRRNRSSWLLALVTAVVVGWLLFARWQDGRQAEERLRMAQRFGSEAEQIESFLRYAYALPAHDVRREKALILERMDRISGRMTDLGELAEGPGHLALGRGHAVLHQPERALEHLELAWHAGERSAGAAHALGSTLGEIYALERQRAHRIRDAVVREERLVELRERYGKRISDLLDQAARDFDATRAIEHLEGLSAYYEGRFDEAASLGEKANTAAPWLPDGLRLRGDALRAKGESAVAQGDFELASEVFAGAYEALEEASVLAPSDPALAEARCSVHAARSHMERLRRGDLESPRDRGTADCERALLLDPDRAGPRLLSATLHLFSIQNPTLSIDEREQRLQAADEEIAGISNSPSTTEAEAERLRGTIGLSRAVYVARPRGLDPLPLLESAAEAFRRSLEADASLLETRVNLGTTLAISAEEILARGEDPRPTFDLAIDSFEQAIERTPEHAIVLHNLSNLLYRLGEYRWSSGEDPTADFEQVVRHSSRVIELNPSLPMASNLRGAAHEYLGRLEAAIGSDPEPSFAHAEADFETTLEAVPSYHPSWINRSSLGLSRARWQARSGAEPVAYAEAALDAVDQALAIAPAGEVVLFTNLAEAQLFLAAFERSQGLFEDSRLIAAREAIREALDRDPNDELAHIRRATERLETARRESLAGKSASARAITESTIAELDALLEARPHFVRFRAWSAELRLWLALWSEPDRGSELSNEALGRLGTLPESPIIPPRAALLRAWATGVESDESFGGAWLRSELDPLCSLLRPEGAC